MTTNGGHGTTPLDARDVCDFCGHEQAKEDLRGKVILVCRDQAACLARAHRSAWPKETSRV